MASLSGSFAGKTTLQTTVSLSDVPNHDLNLAEISGRQNSSDPDWNGAELTYWGTADLREGSGAQRGYFVNEHGAGDRDWGTFEGKILASEAQVTLEGTWTFTGGTGKFKGISGGGKYKGRMPSPVEVEIEWEGEYQVALARAAAVE